jgi:TIR domain
MSGIFISYRRDDGARAARRLHEYLSARFGASAVFMDVEDIEVGEDFGAAIDEKVGFCDALIAVIGTKWLTSVDQAGRRRLDDPRDWVRLEIAAALDRGIKVIPVLIDGAALPQAAALPPPLAALPQYQALDLRSDRFEHDVERLAAALEKLSAGRNAVSWFSLVTRRHKALDPLDLHKPEVLGRALRFLLYMVLAGQVIRLPAAASQGQQYWQAGYLISVVAANYVEWLAAAVALHVGMRAVGGRATLQRSVAALCFLSAYLPIIGLSQVPVWGLNISIMGDLANMRWTPSQAAAKLGRFVEELGGFGIIRLGLSFVAATVLWGLLLATVFEAMRTLHRVGRSFAVVAFTAGLLMYGAFLVFFYGALVGTVYQAFGVRPSS